MNAKRIDPKIVRTLDIKSLSEDMADLINPMSLLFKDPEHIKSIESRYGHDILTLASIVDEERKNGRL